MALLECLKRWPSEGILLRVINPPTLIIDTLGGNTEVRLAGNWTEGSGRGAGEM